LNFSFDIPTDWAITPEKVDGTGYFLLGIPNSDTASTKYNECFNGLIFRIMYRDGNLDSALQVMGLHEQLEGIYLTKYRTKIHFAFITEIKGETFKGLHYTISNKLTKITCNRKKNKKIIRAFQFIYFSNGNQTIILETNGAKLDDAIFKRIIDSFTFS